MAYRILNATPSDIPALAELLVLTLGSTAMYDVMFPSDPEHAMQKIMHEGRLKGMFEDPKARVFKMVEVSSNGEPTESTMPNGDASVGAGGPGPRIVGSVALTLSDGEVQDGPLGPGTATAYGNRIRSFQFPPQVNGKACEAIIGGVARLIDTMQGRHYDVSMLGVHPSYRSHRFGSRLLAHCLETADQEGMDTWLCALPGSHGLYLRQGFKDKDYDDVDLDLVDPLDRKLGMFRHQAMFRPARRPDASS